MTRPHLAGDDPTMIAARRARQLPGYFRGVAVFGILGSIGLSIYWAATGSGLYGWLANLQAEHLFADRYYPIPTFAMVFLILAVPVSALLVFVGGAAPTPEIGGSRSIQDVLANPKSLSQAPASYGVARKLNWPEAQVTFRDEGIELARGDAVVACSWALFRCRGHAIVKASSILLPIDPTEIGSVALHRKSQVAATGPSVRTAFFKFCGDSQVEVFVDYPGPLSELGEAILELGRWTSSKNR